MGGSIRPAKEGSRAESQGCQGADVGIPGSAVIGKLLSAGLIRGVRFSGVSPATPPRQLGRVCMWLRPRGKQKSYSGSSGFS